MSLPLEQPAEQVSLTVNAGDSQSDIVILDSRGRFVDRACGPQHTFLLEPGIYRSKILTGTVSQEKTVILKDPHTVSFEAPNLVSSAPLAGTSTSHEYHMAAADRESRVDHITDGTGSWLFFLVRDWTPNSALTASSRVSGNPAEGLSLYAGERRVCDLAVSGARDSTGDPWAACNIAVNPGAYELRLELPAGETLHQTFVASPGWQTQSFLFMRQYPTGSTPQWRADLSRTSVLLSRQKGFQPNEPMLRAAELARVRLATKANDKGGRSERALLPEELRAMLRDKFENPMLGIYGAHLLLLERSFDTGLFAVVVNNLRASLFNHPDVEALSLRTPWPTQAPFNIPPMLSRSWALIVEASLERPEIVTPSLAQWSSGNYLDEGPWHVGLTSSMAAVNTDDLGLSDFESVLAEELGVMKRIRQIQYGSLYKRENVQSALEGQQFSAEVSNAWAGAEAAASASENVNRGENIAQSVITVEIDRDKLRSLTSRFGLPATELKQRISALESKMDRSPTIPNLSVSLK